MSGERTNWPSWVVLCIVCCCTAATASDSSREPKHPPDRSREYRVPAPKSVGQPGATLLFEEFEGSFPPAGWTIVDGVTGGSATSWDLNTAFAAHSGNSTGGTGSCAMACSDCAPGDFDVELRTPVIDASEAENLQLSFRSSYQNFSNYDVFEVNVSTDGGTGWTNVLTWNEDHGAFDDTPGEEVSLDISSIADGSSQVVVSFRYYDPTGFDYDWYVQIDDVELSEAEVRAGIPSLSLLGTLLMLSMLAAAAVVILRRAR